MEMITRVSRVRLAFPADSPVPSRAPCAEPCSPSVLWFIGELHDAFREASRPDEPQGGVLAFPEELLPLPQNERMNREIEHVKQVPFQQRLAEKTVAIDEQVRSVLLLELAHLGDHVASHDGRVGPLGVF